MLIMDIVAWLVFVVEMVIRLAMLRGQYFRRLSSYLDIALVVLTTPLALVPGINALRFLRLLRLVRLLRIPVVFTKAFTEGRRLFIRRSVTVSAAFVVLAVIGVAITANVIEPETFGSFGDALWWSVGTLTTVGYGDFVPASIGARAAGAFLMFTGVAFLGTIAATLAGVFIAERESESRIELDDVYTRVEDFEEELKVVHDKLDELLRRVPKSKES